MADAQTGSGESQFQFSGETAGSLKLTWANLTPPSVWILGCLRGESKVTPHVAQRAWHCVPALYICKMLASSTSRKTGKTCHAVPPSRQQMPHQQTIVSLACLSHSCHLAAPLGFWGCGLHYKFFHHSSLPLGNAFERDIWMCSHVPLFYGSEHPLTDMSFWVPEEECDFCPKKTLMVNMETRETGEYQETSVNGGWEFTESTTC